MSVKGQLLRGEKWFLMNRDADGKLNNKIQKDIDKMIDINLYLEARKPVVEVKKEVKAKEKK